jgi:hypothetical protein
MTKEVGDPAIESQGTHSKHAKAENCRPYRHNVSHDSHDNPYAHNLTGTRLFTFAQYGTTYGVTLVAD